MHNPEKFIPFYERDYTSYDQWVNANDSTWTDYSVVVHENETFKNPSAIIGVIVMSFNRPERIINKTIIANYKTDAKSRRIFYNGLLTVLKLVYDNNHQVMYINTIKDCIADKIYQKLANKGIITAYDIPYEYCIIKGKQYNKSHYAMSREQLGKFLKIK